VKTGAREMAQLPDLKAADDGESSASSIVEYLGQCDTGEQVWVPTSALYAADSPRLSGEHEDHIRALALSEAELPPILVRRATMCVIDGMHRLRAALLRGDTKIRVRFFDGDRDAAFVLAVQSNVTHGLPLTLADRTAAATRIVASHPEWSDRRIALVSGLSPKTVGSARAKSSEEFPQLTARVGRDGRVRHVGHRRPPTVMFSESSGPHVCLPQGAGDSPVPDAAADRAGGRTHVDQPMSGVGTPGAPQLPVQERRRIGRAPVDDASIVSALRKDPSLRFTDSGRKLLRLLEVHNFSGEPLDRLVGAVPAHCADRVAEIARRYSAAWRAFADRIAEHGPPG